MTNGLRPIWDGGFFFSFLFEIGRKVLSHRLFGFQELFIADRVLESLCRMLAFLIVSIGYRNV